MAETIPIGVQPALIADAIRALEQIETGLGAVVTAVLQGAAGDIASGARAFAPFDPEHRLDRKDGLPHIRDTLFGRARGETAEVVSTHPGALPWEWGGSIEPRGVKIRIPRRAMAHRSADERLDALAEMVELGIAGELHAAGL
jgi:hypothetical protein